MLASDSSRYQAGYAKMVPSDSIIVLQLVPLVFNFFSYFTVAGNNVNPSTCGPLMLTKNIEISCSDNEFDGRTLKQRNSECSRSQLVGSVVKYKCAPNHILFDGSNRNLDIENVLKCGTDGEWEGLKRYEAFRCKEDCGRINTNAKPLVVHGVDSNRTQVPWHATIFRKSLNDWVYICGGSLIRNQIIISAAHCFAIDHNIVRNPDEFRIVLGSVSSTFYDNLIEQGTQVHKVQRIHISENYDPKQGFQSDIAIVQLKDNIDFNENVVPICLPNDYKADVNAVKSGMAGTVAGFGVTERGKISENLRTAELRIRSNDECYRALERVLSESQLCGGNKNDDKWETVCNGDSGGGLFVASNVYEKYFIHGIVSSGDPDTENGVCKNYAVFTRIYPFIFWIRDLIEEITGEIARDLHQNAAYPYAVRGSETQMATFNGLPREWINRITFLEVLHASLNTETLLDALDNAKPIEVINLRDVILSNGLNFKRRVVLPALVSFALDVIPVEKEFEVIGTDRTFPFQITEEYLSSLIFFDKDFEVGENWNVESLIDGNVDIEILVQIFRILRIRTDSGELILQQMALANRIIDRYGDNLDFTLLRLALHRCDLDLEKLRKLSTLTELVLDQVSLTLDISSPDILSSVVGNLTNLKILVLNPIGSGKDKMSLNLNSISQNVVHLSVSNLRIQTTHQEPPEPFLKLGKLCCIDCVFSEPMVDNFNILFPNIKSIVLKTNTLLFKKIQLPRLTSIYIDVHEKSALEELLHNYGLKSNQFQNPILLKRNGGNGTWAIQIPSIREQQHFLYSCTKQSRFWSSEEDFQVKWRLKSFENDAVKSGNYKFKGTAITPHALEIFKGIPTQVQPYLKSIHLESVQVPQSVLADSVANCPNLRSLTLSNVTVDISHHKYELIRNQSLEFHLDSIQFTNYKFHYVLEYVDGVLRSVTIPYQYVGRFKIGKISNVLHHLFWNINSIRLTKDDYILYLLDISVAEIRGFDGFVLKVISALPEGHVLRKFLQSLQERYATFKEGILPPAWKYNGLHVIDKNFSKSFFEDDAHLLFGYTGLLDYLLTRFGWFFTITRSTFLTSLDTNRNPFHFPVIQAISVNLNEEQVALRLFPALSTGVTQIRKTN